MTFDWFRRRFDQEAETEQPNEPEATQSESAPSEPETPEALPDEVAEDYLNWAKVAYENIRKRQAEAAQTSEAVTSVPASEPTTEPPTAAAAPSESPSTLEPTEPEPPSVSIPETGVDSLASEPAPPSVDETPVAAESAVEGEEIHDEPVAAEAAVVAEPTSAASSQIEPEPAAVPFWLQAEADRQARLEQLRETAIVEPEPEPQPTTATAALEQVIPPDLVLDEGFLWSAEILASQGRRPDQISLEEITWLKRLRQGLDKTRRGLINQLKAIVGQGPLNQDAVLEIEAALLQADVGVEATDAIIDALQQKLRDEVLPPDAAISYLKQILRDMLDHPLTAGDTASLFFAPEKDQLNIWLMTGVNGAGKTTTIGKLAHIAQKSGYKCLIGAADTFRAAAVEQVKVWGQRSNVEVISNPGKNTDPAAVVFDAITAAQARGTELLLIDTAGRLQNKKNLMDELSKVRRIIDKKAPDAIVESLLVLDATLGQNGLRQAEVFSEAAKLSGVVLTKLDGTAKGGIALAVVKQLGLPIRFIGAGEGIEDLRPFSSYEFVEALLDG
ncbi:signal recognition particle-docking protein FtsY [Pantanalinema sp. GBBB05]|uniref:signal recognition particle-docking protein FtsY n=1 Tax=Pantanalinema sp. GBBB05 TaxID=2604139 RepID=UPI001D49FB8B|nr:signal recognition particle-docking protein FtsY [Pantanalinema sp. GBBB05]